LTLLKILHINDLHGHVAHLTPQGEEPVLSRMAGHLAALRATGQREGFGVLALSAGDDCVGSPFDLLLGQDDPFAFHAHAAYRLYSAVGLDACAIGNHDLDWGEAHLARALTADARFPALSANLTGCRELAGRFLPAAIFVVQGVRVAVIGLTTPAQVARLPGSTLTVADPLAALHNLLPLLTPISDVRIVLSHLGHSLASHPAAVVGAGDVELARSLPPGAVHLIVGGHTHHALNRHGLDATNVVNGVPIVQAGSFGEFMGEVELTVASGRVEATHARLIPTDDLPVDEEFDANWVQSLAREARRRMETTLGHVADSLDQPALARFAADGLAERCRLAGFAVDCAAVDGSCAGIGLAPGPLTLGDWRSVMPYADTIQLLRLSGRALLELLRASSDAPLHFSREVVRRAAPTGRSQPAPLDARVHGLPLAQQMERVFTLACTSFMARVTQPALAAAGVQETGLFVRRELAAYVRTKGGVAAGEP
jgi:2',3'-cyclic-nucleotide 2'-phosphodiesterase (5'-nucleotidase family)